MVGSSTKPLLPLFNTSCNLAVLLEGQLSACIPGNSLQRLLLQLPCADGQCGLIFGAGTTQPAAQVSYVERIRAMSALFNVGEMATSEVSQAALQAALNSVRDGSIFAANHYADALDIYV